MSNRKQNILIGIVTLLVIIFGVPLGTFLYKYGHGLKSYMGDVSEISGIILLLICTISGTISFMLACIGAFRNDQFGDI